jgi:hypothetical protein
MGVARPPPDRLATHPISLVGDIYIYIYIFFLAGNAPHLAGWQYIIFFFSRRPRTPSCRPAIYNLFFLSPAAHPILPAIFFSLASNIFFFLALMFLPPNRTASNGVLSASTSSQTTVPSNPVSASDESHSPSLAPSLCFFKGRSCRPRSARTRLS